MKDKVSIRRFESKYENALFLMLEEEGDDWKDYWEGLGKLKFQKALGNSRGH